MLQIRTNTKAGNGLTIHAFMSAVDELRKLDPELQLQTVKVFLLVAEQPGILQGDIANLANISQGGSSRNVHALGKRHRKGKPGLGLIAQRSDDEDIRRVRLYLTDRGRALLDRLAFNNGGDEAAPLGVVSTSQCADPMRFELSFSVDDTTRQQSVRCPLVAAPREQVSG